MLSIRMLITGTKFIPVIKTWLATKTKIQAESKQIRPFKRREIQTKEEQKTKSYLKAGKIPDPQPAEKEKSFHPTPYHSNTVVRAFPHLSKYSRSTKVVPQKTLGGLETPPTTFNPGLTRSTPIQQVKNMNKHNPDPLKNIKNFTKTDKENQEDKTEDNDILFSEDKETEEKDEEDKIVFR